MPIQHPIDPRLHEGFLHQEPFCVVNKWQDTKKEGLGGEEQRDRQVLLENGEAVEGY